MRLHALHSLGFRQRAGAGREQGLQEAPAKPCRVEPQSHAGERLLARCQGATPVATQGIPRLAQHTGWPPTAAECPALPPDLPGRC